MAYRSIRRKVVDQKGDTFVALFAVYHDCGGLRISASINRNKLEWNSNFCPDCGVKLPHSIKELKDLGLIEEGEKECSP